MKPYTLVTEARDLPQVAAKVAAAHVIGLDIECTSLDPAKGRIRLVQISLDKGTTIYVIDLFRTRTLGPLKKVLASTKQIKVIHNAKFEQKWFWFHHEIRLWPVFCTFRASALIYNGKELEQHLYALYSRELGIDPEIPDMGESDWGGVLTKTQLDYAAEDVCHLHALRVSLRAKLEHYGLLNAALIEFGVLFAEGCVELNGFHIDQDKWKDLAVSNSEVMRELHNGLLKKLPHPKGQLALPGFVPSWNINSPAQIKDSLKRLGIKKLDSTNNNTLSMIAAKHPVVLDVLQFRHYKQRVQTFGESWLRWVGKDSRIHSEFWGLLATGRYSCVAGWTKVKTRRGRIPISEVRAGDYVWTHKGRWRKVLRSFTKGVDRMYDVHFSNGKILTCTARHRLRTSSGEWVFVGRIVDECFENVGRFPEESRGGGAALPVARASNNAAGSKEARNNVSQCIACVEEGAFDDRAEGASKTPVFGFENGSKESDEREVRGRASQLEGSLRGRVWVPDVHVQRKENVCPSHSCDGGVGVGGHTGGIHSASHRSRQNEQRFGQSSSDDEGRARLYTLYADEGLPSCTIEKVNVSGSFEVYDITVEEDESYEACGVYSHNSSKPNLQNIPRDKAFRACFTAAPGKRLVAADYSGIEMRLVAQISGDPKLIDVFVNGDGDPHRATAALVMGKHPEDVTKSDRQQAKPVNFGLIYGMQPPKLVIYALVQYKVRLSKRDAQVFRNRFFSSDIGYGGIARWHDRVIRDGARMRYSRTLSGRIRFLDPQRAHNEFYNTPIQGTGADGLKRALAIVHDKALKYGSSIEPVHHVHDEIVLEVDDNDECDREARRLLEEGMIEGMSPFLTKVPVDVDAASGYSWAEAK